MIVDSIKQHARYSSLHPGFERAFEVLRRALRDGLEPGKHTIIDDRLFIICARDQGRGKAASPLESHRKYIDIQCVLQGVETIGWRPTDDCGMVSEAYQPSRDIGFFADAPTLWLELQVAEFAIFYPSDAHAPSAGNSEVLKAVAKVSVDW
jgi:biofilm protein TabA